MARKINLLVIIFVVITIFLFLNNTKANDITLEPIYLNEEGYEINRMATVNGIANVASFSIRMTLQNTGDVPLYNVSFSDAYPSQIRTALINTPKLEKLEKGSTFTITSDPINATPFEGQNLNILVNISTKYFDAQGKTVSTLKKGSIILNIVKDSGSCGNSYCEVQESIATCPQDCTGSPMCGNKLCQPEYNENKDNCPSDCGVISGKNRTIGVLYHPRDEMYNLLKQEVSKHPGEADWEVIGQSIQGKDILMFKFGNPNGGKFMFDGQGHGPEDCGTEIGYLFVQWVMNSNEAEAVRIRNNNYLLFIPIINVDTTKRQNMRRSYTLANGTVLQVPYGVDMNRNFPTGFGGSGSGNISDSYQYRGLYGGSEPEVQAVRNAMIKYRPQVYMNTHCGMNWLSSSSYSKAENTTKIKSLIAKYENKKNPLKMTTVQRYGNGTFGTGGYFGTEGAVWGGSGWIFEISDWGGCPKELAEFNNRYWNISSVVYRAMANAVEVPK